MKKEKRMEFWNLPSSQGMIKVWVYGFQHAGDFGRAIAVSDNITVTTKGYNRKKTIVRSLAKLHQVLLDQQKGS